MEVVMDHTVGEVVHWHGKPYVISWIKGEHAGLTSMCERKYFVTVQLNELEA
jgi:hypothetical protein